jgi:3-deoxy-alpha-D-manno-octulosonate 8-oxidase
MSSAVLDTGIKLVRNVGRMNFGCGSLDELPGHVDKRRRSAIAGGKPGYAIYLIDEFFIDKPKVITRLNVQPCDELRFVATSEEPTTKGIDQLVKSLQDGGYDQPAAIIGLGGGTTLDTSKAVSNLLTNGGCASQYQGWDLVKVPGIYKIGIPSISGTGSEATRTCVMINTESRLKLGMNSDHTVFNHVILDPDLNSTVPRDQYFYTGSDAYLHSMESLTGSYRNAIGDAYSRETMNICREVFLAQDMMSSASREQLMVASYLGGCAIATSYVGLVHPFSAGLSVVLGLPHGVANCIVMRAMAQFYPAHYDEFWGMVEKQKITIPSLASRGISEDQFQALISATVIHEKPLTNALGSNYREILSDDKIVALFQKM